MKKLMTSTMALGAILILEMNHSVNAINTESTAPHTLLVRDGRGHHMEGRSHHMGEGGHHMGRGEHHAEGHPYRGEHEHYRRHYHDWGAAGVGVGLGMGVVGTEIINQNTYEENYAYPDAYQEDYIYSGDDGSEEQEYYN